MVEECLSWQVADPVWNNFWENSWKPLLWPVAGWSNWGSGAGYIYDLINSYQVATVVVTVIADVRYFG